MKLLVKKTSEKPVNGAETQSTTSSYSIENLTVAIIGVLTSIATALGTYIGNLPKHHIDNSLLELKTKYFNVLIMERVLGDTNVDERRKSLNLLIASGIIGDPKNEIKAAIDKSMVPKWVIQSNDQVNAIFVTPSNAEAQANASPKPKTGANEVPRTQSPPEAQQSPSR